MPGLTPSQVLTQEIEALKIARRSKTDMDDYLCDFEKYTSHDLIRTMESARYEINRLNNLLKGVEVNERVGKAS